MTVHHLHLHPEPFALIASGNKRVEARLLDEKRRGYRVGDYLLCVNRGDNDQQIEVMITDLHPANSFYDLFTNPHLKGKFSTTSVDELVAGVMQYYSPEDEKKYGVVGIEFRLLPREK